MAIGALETYLAQRPTEIMHRTKIALTVVAGRMYSDWLVTPFAGTAPTTAAVPSRTIAGAIGQSNAASSAVNLRLRRLAMARSNPGMMVLCDRLSHQGGLSGITTGAQTTNLPTAALTRYTDGEGVMAALEIYTQIGATSTTVTASYTNQAGTAGRTTQATPWGNTGFREASRFVILPLQQGDTGVRAVASVTNAATTGTAGAFGVTLFKPLLVVPVSGAFQDMDAMLGLACQNLRILDDACLFWLHMSTTTSTGVLQYTAEFAQDS